MLGSLHAGHWAEGSGFAPTQGLSCQELAGQDRRTSSLHGATGTPSRRTRVNGSEERYMGAPVMRDLVLQVGESAGTESDNSRITGTAIPGHTYYVSATVLSPCRFGHTESSRLPMRRVYHFPCLQRRTLRLSKKFPQGPTASEWCSWDF